MYEDSLAMSEGFIRLMDFVWKIYAIKILIFWFNSGQYRLSDLEY